MYQSSNIQPGSTQIKQQTDPLSKLNLEPLPGLKSVIENLDHRY